MNKPDVRAQIVRTARELLEEDGFAALSMREVARRAGVTHQAPYHHFTDREAILAEVVTEGFTELADVLQAANSTHIEGHPRETILSSGQAYIGFALTHPGVFRIMFRPDLCDPSRFERVRETGEHAFAQLGELVRLVYGHDVDPTILALFWAQVHGLASLAIDAPAVLHLTTAKEQHAFLRSVAEKFTDLVLGPGAPQAMQ